jgi:hypothetical protein
MRTLKTETVAAVLETILRKGCNSACLARVDRNKTELTISHIFRER